MNISGNVNIQVEPSVSHDEYMKLHPGAKWYNYWDDVMRPLYVIEYWKIIDKLSLRDLVEDILSRFDFQTVEEYMRSMEWRWSDKPTSPTIQDMKSTILELITDGIKYDDGNENSPGGMATGGFYVQYQKRNNIIYEIKITFKDELRGGFELEEKTKLSIIRKKKLLSLGYD